jgi:hypothetical protein
LTAVRRVVTALTVGLLLASVVGASAQIFVPQSLERYFRVEWRMTRDRKGPAVEGYVYNTAGRTAERMRLQIDRVDASGSVIGNSIIWLPGDVHRNDRAFFSSSVPESASYRVQVLSFDWACDGGGGGM